jgi:hypothetical protein
MPKGNAEGFASAKRAGWLRVASSRTGTQNRTQCGVDTGFDRRKSVRPHLIGGAGTHSDFVTYG